jgi:2'-5' RNA ligase
MSDRLFFAFWPDAAIRHELERRLPAFLADASDGRPQRPDQWHVTLEFLGAVDAKRQPRAWAAADRVTVTPVEIEFDVLEHWRKPQVYSLVASRTPSPLAHMVDTLRAALAVEGFEPETRPYRPHVTLARKVRRARDGALQPPLLWRADRFTLVRSVTGPPGSRYEPLRWWNGEVRED